MTVLVRVRLIEAHAARRVDDGARPEQHLAHLHVA
eukprot:CAMPEP_0175927918 /NCGR_PEP_ID=MMETSP0108-20121206/16976_1 /TAXON_ID=195067 ORGANISM="Goniomonas pacifica, Strain CCMP1869" /NCGR_SAMPLE_ID=MMETSP0108 /ASSEMBLY_ACC=CAM_ASM_000204 /LENGTH=34 /DNA_ID= /DNA_START= /DNA_END= /DNA_ORIENTATION=